MLDITNISWSPEQERAITELEDWYQHGDRRMLSLSGAAGTGKTTTLLALKEKLCKRNTAWTAMTGKAAHRVTEVTGIPTTTLHKVLYDPPEKDEDGRIQFNNVADPKNTEFLIIDEASMMGPFIYEGILNWVRAGVKVLFLGDGYQLPPVMTDSEVHKYGYNFSIFSEVPGPFLSKVMRGGGIFTKIGERIRNGELPDSQGPYQQKDCRSPQDSAINAYMENSDDHAIITWTNRSRMGANRSVRHLKGYKRLDPYPGEPILFCNNSAFAMNGEFGIVESLEEAGNIGPVEMHMVRVRGKANGILASLQGREQRMDGHYPKVEDFAAYNAILSQLRTPEPTPITYGYALTAHKCQGSEFREVSIFLNESDMSNNYFHKDTYLPNGEKMPFINRWFYTAVTRASERVTVYLES